MLALSTQQTEDAHLVESLDEKQQIGLPWMADALASRPRSRWSACRYQHATRGAGVATEYHQHHDQSRNAGEEAATFKKTGIWCEWALSELTGGSLDCTHLVYLICRRLEDTGMCP